MAGQEAKGDFQWYVVRVAPHNVPRARQELIGKALLYSPMRKVIYNIRGNRRSAEWPALPGYVFLFAVDAPETWAAIRETYGVQELLTPAGEPPRGVPWRCPASHVDHLRRLEQNGEWDEMKSYLAEITRQPRRRRRARKMKPVEKLAAA